MHRSHSTVGGVNILVRLVSERLFECDWCGFESYVSAGVVPVVEEPLVGVPVEVDGEMLTSGHE